MTRHTRIQTTLTFAAVILLLFSSFTPVAEETSVRTYLTKVSDTIKLYPYDSGRSSISSNPVSTAEVAMEEVELITF